MSRLRVFHLIKGLGRGGAEGLLAAGLRAAGSERFVWGCGYFLSAKDALAAQLGAAGVEVVCFPAAGAAALLARVPRVARFLRRWRPDVVHAHLPLSGVAGRLAGRLAGVPVVYTEHNLLGRYHPWSRRANLWTWRLQDRVVAVSEDVAASIRRHVPGSPVPVRVVVNGVDPEAFAPDPGAAARVRRELGIPEGAPVVGQVAVFRPQKRLDRWLETAAAIHRARPETRFLLVGEGPEGERVARRAGELDLTGVLHLPGLREDVAACLSAMDVFLLTSDYEGLPVALLEAMAAQRPVVATAVGGVPEVLGPEGEPCGVLVTPGEAGALTAAVLELLADPRARRRLGGAARHRAAGRFGLERMMRELEEVYRELADDR